MKKLDFYDVEIKVKIIGIFFRLWYCNPYHNHRNNQERHQKYSVFEVKQQDEKKTEPKSVDELPWRLGAYHICIPSEVKSDRFGKKVKDSDSTGGISSGMAYVIKTMAILSVGSDVRSHLRFHRGEENLRVSKSLKLESVHFYSSILRYTIIVF